jgi:hypothetical protein
MVKMAVCKIGILINVLKYNDMKIAVKYCVDNMISIYMYPTAQQTYVNTCYAKH